MVLVNGHSALLLSCDMKFWAFALEILFNTFLGNGCANLNESNGRPPWNLKFEYILTEYKYDYYSVWKNRLNTNIIQFEKIDWIRIRILFGLKKSTEFEYEYYLVWKNRPNTNTNTSIPVPCTLALYLLQVREGQFWYVSPKAELL